MKEIDLSMEIRHLPAQIVSELGNILQIDCYWKEVMSLIPSDPWVSGQPLPEGKLYSKRYSAEDICLVSEESNQSGRSGFEVIIEEWGTSGKIRAKVSDLINIFYKAGIHRAALRLCKNLKDPQNCELFDKLNILEPETVPCLSENQPFTLPEINCDNIPIIPFEEIELIAESGSVLGVGSFGDVYKAHLTISGIEKLVAIKMLKDLYDSSKLHVSKEKVFKTEIEILSRCSHNNIIELVGYSSSINGLALIYPFMANGSLFDQISSKIETDALPWTRRIDILKGTAEGIVYLHTAFEPPLVHRDIKSPNILLSEEWIPKLGDFGIVHSGARCITASTVVKTTPVGTQMYMAPEAFRGDVSVKMDTFSFAIVVLELLTGLLFFDERREHRDLLSFVQEYEGDEIELLDTHAGEWDIEVAAELFRLAETCTAEKKKRPDMVSTLTLIKEICSSI